MTTNSRTETVNRIAACEGAIDALAELHTWPDADRGAIAGLYDEIRQGTSLARVHALLYIGDQLDRLVDKLDDGRLSRDEVDALIAQGDRL